MRESSECPKPLALRFWLSLPVAIQVGAATVLGTSATAGYARCAVADDRDNVSVCDPVRGCLLVFHDTFPGSK